MGNTDHANITSWLHICTKKLQRELTVFQSWPLEWSCLSSKWNWFRCNVPSQTGLEVWQFQTISPWTVRAKTHMGSKTMQNTHWRVWINLHTLVVSVKYMAGVLSNLFLISRECYLSTQYNFTWISISWSFTPLTWRKSCIHLSTNIQSRIN